MHKQRTKIEFYRGILLVLLLNWQAFAAYGVDCSIADNAIDAASRLRGLRVVRQVPCRLQNRKEVEQYLRDTIRKKITNTRLKREGEMYRLLGFIPHDYDYLDGIISLYTNQLGGYYDPEKEYYAMASWLPAAMQMPIAVHELTHALQDQHFTLDDIIDHKLHDSDALMARSALVEGDATAVMLDYSRGLQGRGSVAFESSVSGFMVESISGSMISAALHDAPPALQAMMIFPYVSGINFVHEILKTKGFKGVDEAYKRLPSSTEEILHPDKYVKQTSDWVRLADGAPPKGVSVKSDSPVYSDRLGEFAISTLLGTWIPPLEASSAAAGWGGDRVSLFELKNSSRSVLVWTSNWDSEKDAAEFFDKLTLAYEKRFAANAVRTSTAASFIDKNIGTVKIKRKGLKVVVTIT